MTTYKFKVGSKNSIMCYIIKGNTCKKLRGKKALNLFNSINDLNIISHSTTIKNNILSHVFASNNELYVFENEKYFRNLNIISFDDKVNELNRIVKINNIKLEKERLINQKKELQRSQRLYSLKKALYSGAIAAMVGITSIGGIKNNKIVCG